MLPPLYEQKGILCPDGDWLCKRARENRGGLVAVASLVEPQKFDGLKGSWSQAIVPRMMMAGESMRGLASITEQHLICMKLLRIFSCAPPSLCKIAACAWMRTMLVSRRISTSGARSVVPRIGVFGVQCPMRFTTDCPCAIRIIEFCSFMASMVRRSILARCCEAAIQYVRSGLFRHI